VAAALAARGVGPASLPEEVLDVVGGVLFGQHGFRVPFDGASALPGAAVVDHPGAWEKASWCYLSDVLPRKVGAPAALAVIYGDVMRALLQAGAVDFAVRLDAASYASVPRPVVLPGLTRAALLDEGGRVLNTNSADALAEVLRGLKRPFWPFPWDVTADAAPGLEAGGLGYGSRGGFAGAARAALEGERDATAEAISRFAQYRLERGIFTSTNGGDLRRALLATERLVLLGEVGASGTGLERRDYAALLMHAGRLGEARCELRAFRESGHAGGQGAEERGLCDRLWGVLEGLRGDLEEPDEPLSVARQWREDPPPVVVLPEAIPW